MLLPKPLGGGSIRGHKGPLHTVLLHENSRVLPFQASTLAAEGKAFWMVTGSAAVLILNFPAGQASFCPVT